MHSSQDLIRIISAQLGVLPIQLEQIVRTSPLRYKVFTIPKRDGSLRTVAQPAREVKAIQRWLISDLSSILPVHPSATAYQTGMSIKINAEQHLKNDFLLKMDFQNFFPSIQFSDLCTHLQKYAAIRYDHSAIEMISRLCCWAPERRPPLRLCIGAPSSPLISNSILYDFDCYISEISSNYKVSYTRYADDLTFSCNNPDILKKYQFIVKDFLASMASPSLKINAKKTVFASRSGLRMVTGITLTPDGNLSVGRERKRLARSMFHRFSLNKLSEKEIEKMYGLLAFIDHIEPGFSFRLKREKTSPGSDT